MVSMQSNAMLPVPEEMHTFAPKCKTWSQDLHGPQNGLGEHKVCQSHLRNMSQGPDLMVADMSSQLLGKLRQEDLSSMLVWGTE